MIVIVFFLFAHDNDQRERTLLQDETMQAATVASSMLSNFTSSLESLAATVTTSNGSTSAFTAEAQAVVHPPASVALLKAYLTRYVVFAAVGDSFRVDEVLEGAVATELHAGGAAVDTGPVMSQGDQSTATFAVGSPLVPNGNAILLQFTVNPFTTSLLPVSREFSDLHVALYGSSQPERANLVASTSHQLVWSGPLASEPVAVGNGTWTLVAGARGPLIGASAAAAPLLILILGLLLAAATGLAIEGFMRRRNPALTTLGAKLTASETPEATSDVTPPKPQNSSTPPPPEYAEIIRAPRETPAPENTPESKMTIPMPEDVPVANNAEQPPVPPAQGEAAESAAATNDPPDRADQAPGSEASFYADWRPDPFGRFELRRFFLGSPTSLVKSGSIEGYDPAFAGVGPAPTAPPPPPDAPTDERPPIPSADKEPNLPDGNESEPASKQGPEESGRGPIDAQHALEVVVAQVANTIADELDELRAVTSALNDYLPQPAGVAAPLNPESPPSLPPPPAETAGPPRPTMATPPPPPHTPPPTPPAPTPTSTRAPLVAASDGTHRGRPHENARVIAVVGGILGAASLVWRRLRKPPSTS